MAIHAAASFTQEWSTPFIEYRWLPGTNSRVAIHCFCSKAIATEDMAVTPVRSVGSGTG
jgi:hypothetical protein